ncbi:MAG: hypothetical protein CMN77_00790 [Spirochaetaceae bacterium]|nr:hypothetical protein [Spirochaetaceae bacterium]
MFIFTWSTASSWNTLSRPLDLRHDWLTAHTAINLEYMRKCGPRALGASILFLPVHELDCKSPFRLEKPGKRIYLSYPTGWLLALYPPYSLARWMIPQSVPDYLVVRGLGLLLIRLPLIALILWWMNALYRWAVPELKSDASFWLGFASATFLFSSPSFLHYTQNALFTDMFVLAPVYGSTVILFNAWKKRKFSPASGTVLWLLLWLSAATDWYGAVWLGFVICSIPFLFRDQTRISLLVISISAAAVAALHFVAQALILDPELSQILATAGHRTGAGFDPMEYLNSLKILIQNTIFLFPVSPIIGRGLMPVVIFSLALAGSSLLLILQKKSRRGWLLLAPFYSGIIHLLLLSQHSAEHDFAVLKFGPVLVMVLPVLAGKWASWMDDSSPGSKPRWSLSVVLLTCAVLFYFAAGGKELHLRTAGRPWINQDHLAMKEIGEHALGPNEIPVTLESKQEEGFIPLEARGWDPPIGLALAGREIYTQKRLMQYMPAMKPDAGTYKIVLLALSRRSGCPSQWESTNIHFQDSTVLICRTGLTLDLYSRLAVE